jgi:GTPase SAR1 family protein
MFGYAVALCGATLYVGAPHGGGGGEGGEHASGSPGCVQYAHVNEDGEPALKEQDAGILWQCVRGRAGVSLPENVFHRAGRKVLRDKGAPWPLAKIMMIGEGRAGKTALRNALLGKPFVETNSTIGIETLMVGRLAITGTGQGQWVEEMEVEVDGVESEMRERAVAKHCVIEMHESTQVAAPVQRKAMVDLMRQKLGMRPAEPDDPTSSFMRNNLKSVLGSLSGGGGAGEVDEAVPQLDMKRVEEYMRSCDEEREELAMEIWDFGGQPVFYILYHLFLTEFGTYLLTFSMERLVPSADASEREGCLGMIRYWLDNIALHTGTGREEHNAPLVLVGTHKDKVLSARDHEAISQLLWSRFSQHVQWPYVVPLKEGVVSTGRGLLWFYPVDNTRSTGVGRDPVLGQLITSLEAKVQAKDHVHRTVPFSWMSLYDKLQAEKQAGNLVVSMDKVLGFARDCDVASGDVSLVLRYFDCMGLLLYCAETRMHGSAVVLDTVRLLVRAATLVLCQHDIHLESLHQEAAQTMGALWQELINYGILDLSLLPLLWKDFESSSHPILLSLMHRFGLICPIATASVGRPPSRFVVPCLLPDDPISTPPGTARTCFLAFSSGPTAHLSDSDTLTYDALHNFFMPEGLFARVVAKCVEWIQQTSRDKTPLRAMSLKRREAFLSFGPHRCILQHVPEIHSLRVHILVQNTDVVSDRLEAIVVSVIEETYPKLTATLLVPCDGADHNKGSGKLLPLHVLRRAVEEKRGLWLGEALASSTELAAQFSAFLPLQGLLGSYDVFISHRWTPKQGAVCDDSSLAVKLYDKMSSWALGSEGRRPEIFLDRFRLQHGRRFDDDCMMALSATTIVVPIVTLFDDA